MWKAISVNGMFVCSFSGSQSCCKVSNTNVHHRMPSFASSIASFLSSEFSIDQQLPHPAHKQINMRHKTTMLE